jgi:hypothetical protein
MCGRREIETYLHFLDEDVRHITRGGGNYFYDLLLSSAEVKERVYLYFYYPSGPLWSVLEWRLLLSCIHRYSSSLVSFSSLSESYKLSP